ncbi:MAG: peptidoglycan-binding domain-containing protein [Aeromicrobium sp.]
MNRAAASVLLALLLVSACSGSDDKPEASPTEATETSAAAPAPAPASEPAPAPTKKADKPKVKTLSTAGRKCTELEETSREFPGHNLSMAIRGQYLQEVQEAQSLINGAGDGTKCIPEDGDFGPVTRDAVIAFQKKNGIVADGLVGKQTWDKLNSILID